MAAARVLNPVVLTEFCKIGAASPVNVGRNMPCARQLTRIKRDLFGVANTQETNKIFKEELEKYQERASTKWGFDFRNGSPMTTNSRYVWERVSFQESSYAPEMYTLTRAAHVRPEPSVPTAMDLLMDERAERENFMLHHASSTDAETDSCDDSQDESMVVFKLPANVKSAASGSAATSNSHGHATQSTSTIQLRKRQPRITEFMKERKRLVQAPKKLSPPAKRMRTSSGSSAVSHPQPAASSNPHSISSHFTLRSLQHFK